MVCIAPISEGVAPTTLPILIVHSYIVLASFENPFNVLQILDFDSSTTKQPIAFGGTLPQTTCFRDSLLGLAPAPNQKILDPPLISIA